MGRIDAVRLFPGPRCARGLWPGVRHSAGARGGRDPAAGHASPGRGAEVHRHPLGGHRFEPQRHLRQRRPGANGRYPRRSGDQPRRSAARSAAGFPDPGLSRPPGPACRSCAGSGPPAAAIPATPGRGTARPRWRPQSAEPDAARHPTDADRPHPTTRTRTSRPTPSGGTGAARSAGSPTRRGGRTAQGQGSDRTDGDGKAARRAPVFPHRRSQFHLSPAARTRRAQHRGGRPPAGPRRRRARNPHRHLVHRASGRTGRGRRAVGRPQLRAARSARRHRGAQLRRGSPWTATTYAPNPSRCAAASG